MMNTAVMVVGLWMMIGMIAFPAMAETTLNDPRHHFEIRFRHMVARATPRLQAQFPELTHVSPNLATLAEVGLVMNATDWTPDRKRKAAEAGQAILAMPVRMFFPDSSTVYASGGKGGRTMYFPNPDIFAKAIGKPHTSREGQMLFDALGITEVDLEKHPMGLDDLRIWDDMDMGLQLGFEDAGTREEINSDPNRQGPWLVTEVIFWNVPTSERPYAGAKPFGLQFSMTRQEVRERVTAKMTFEDASADAWELEGLELVVNYIEGTQAIRCVSYNTLQEMD